MKPGFKPKGHLGVTAALAVLLGVSFPVHARKADHPGPNAREGAGIVVLSGHANMVTGGDALVELTGDAHKGNGQRGSRVLEAYLNGERLPDGTFALRSNGRIQGLVTHLADGKNTLRVRTSSGTEQAVITNYPITGPVISGPHQRPFVCQTHDFVIPVIGETLGAPLDEDCSVETRVDYIYMSTAGVFKPLPSKTGPRPDDLVKTTTKEGRTVDYVVRVETGTINRAIYEIAALHDPASEADPTPWRPPAGWNERLIYSYTGGCGPGYRQGALLLGVVNDAPLGDWYPSEWLAAGYAVASSTLNTFATNCNDVLSAETTMMVKERFVEQFGAPRYTIGWGASGASMQQHLIANNYPGLLDGLVPSQSFADTLALIVNNSDCGLLMRAFDTATVGWSMDEQVAVQGFGNPDFCRTPSAGGWGALFATNDPNRGCDQSTISPDLIYDPEFNPDGVRCTYHDNMANIYGRDPRTGFAYRPLDNVGIQYGLKAFNEGVISFDQFAELNSKVGGYDIDGNFRPERSKADSKALESAYREGRIDTAENLDLVPIISFRRYSDRIVDPHDMVRPYTTRARLIAANGHADNQVILVDKDSIGPGAGGTLQAARLSLDLVDAWLASIRADHAPGSLADKVLRNKPADAVDSCWTEDGTRLTDPAACEALYPIHSNPRMVAGEPLSNDVLKCRLKAVTRDDYTAQLTDEQFEQLREVFPQGVCDYTKPGVGQKPLKDTWLSYPRPGVSVPLVPGRK